MTRGFLRARRTRPRVPSRVATGALLAAGSALAYGSLAVLVKIAYADGWNTPSLLVARFALAALTVAPFAWRGDSWRGAGGAFLVGAIGYAGTTALYFPSLRHLPAAVASFLLYLAPALVALLGWLLLRERLSRRAWGALALALAGLALLTGRAWTGGLSPTGVALAGGSAVTFAFAILGSRHLVAGLPWPRTTLMVSLGALASYVAFSLATRQLAFPLAPRGLVAAILIGTLSTGLALSLFMAALPRIGAARTALVSTLEPVATLALAALVLAEVPSWAGLAGGALIVGAAALVALEDEAGVPPLRE